MRKRALLASIFSCLLLTAADAQSAFAVEEIFSPADDSFVNSVYPTNTYGGAGSLVCGRIPAGAIRWPVLRFDLASVPENAAIDRVILKLYSHEASGLTTIPIETIFLDESWDEASVNWNQDLETHGDPAGHLG